jgi:acyl dehydratase
MSERYLEDFSVGQIYGSGRITVKEDRIKAFAAEFDPQPFHLDDDYARRSIFGGLAASGWHTAALTMRLLVESDFKPAGGLANRLRFMRRFAPAGVLDAGIRKDLRLDA